MNENEFSVKRKKFEKGYLKSRKRRLWLNIGMNLLFSFAIFFMGLLLNKMDARNIFSVISILFVLPIARNLSILTVLGNFGDAKEADLQRVGERVEGRGILLYGTVFTSKERSMYLSLIAIFQHRIFGYVEKPSSPKKEDRHKKNMEESKKYLDQHLKNQGRGENIVIFDDIEKFLKAIPKAEADAESLKEMEDLKKSMEFFVV